LGGQLITISSGATGDTVVAGNGISVSRLNNEATITNTGVTGIGFGNDTGLVGKINLTGSAITVSGNLITFTSGSGGVPSVNGNTSAITITGAGSNAAVSVRSAVAGTHLIDARIATTTGLTGVASFDSGSFAVTLTGHTTIKANGISNAQLANSSITINSGSGISVSGTPSLGGTVTVNNTGVTGIAFGTQNTTAMVGQVSLTAGSGVTITRSGNQITIGANASVGATGDTVWGDSSVLVGAGSTSGAIWTGGYIAGTNNKKLTARLASYVRVGPNGIPEGMLGYNYPGLQPNYEDTYERGRTGVAYFDEAAFVVNPQYGLVRIRGSFFAPPGSGLSAGVSGDDAATSLFFDPGNLTAYTGAYSNKKTNFVLVFDGDETGLVKAKRASLENFFSENSSLIKSSTTGQLSNAVKKDNGLGTNTIELGVVLGNVAAGQEGLVKGASAFAYIETNTVRSFNGLTGAVTAVGSINGCTAAVVITGSASEIEVLNTCPNIVIGLPDNVTISNLNVLSGATFAGMVSVADFLARTVGGDEGGEIKLGLAQTNTTLTGNSVTIDVYQNRLRIFESGGSARGYYMDLSAAAAAAGSQLATSTPYTPPVATTSLTGVASFNPIYFTTGTTGHVSLAAGYQVTGDTIVAGSFINFSQSGTTKTLNNIGVQSFNGATGAVLADAVTWSVITADQTAVINRGYFANKGTLLTLTLPTTAAVGSVIRVSGMNAGLWRIAQNASEVIHFGKTDTTVGTSGYLESTLARDSVELICCVADNEWNVVSSVGNITIA
jgi:hypothetical protein